jgi:MscS family membrane protein
MPDPVTQPATRSSNWTQALTDQVFLGNALWQWLALVGTIVFSAVVGKVFSAILRRAAERLKAREKRQVPGLILEALAGPIMMGFLAAGLYAASFFMNLTVPLGGGQDHDLRPFWLNTCSTILVIAAGWFIYRLIAVLELYLARWTSKTETALDDELVPVIRKVLRVVVLVLVGLFIAQNIFGWDMPALLAGLGIGGLAFALAAKDMLANLFGSITIFSDRPFRRGERVVIRGHDGTVENVGFRSTRIRTLAGHLVTLPNSVVANEPVENVGRRPSIRRVLDVTITYDTPPEKVQRAVEIVREMLDARKEHFPADQPPRVYFNDFNAASLNIVVYYWFAPPDWWAYLEFTHEFNMELLRRYNEEGIEFAFPTQTLYVRKDG